MAGSHSEIFTLHFVVILYSPILCSTLFPPDRPELTVQLFKEAEVDPKTRPTHLSTSEYGRLALVYRDICNEHPGMLDYDYRSPENAETWRKSRPNFNK